MSGFYRARGGMPTTGWGALNEVKVNFVRAQVTRVYVLGGRQYIDAHNAMTGSDYVGCPVMGLGGGETRWAHVPIAGDQGEGRPVFNLSTQSDPSSAASAQVLLLFDGVSEMPWCIGTIQHPKFELQDETPETERSKDRKDEYGHQDIVSSNGGSTTVLDSLGQFAVVLADGKQATVQLEGNGLVRISRNGEADERLVLANRLVSYLGGLEAQVDDLINRVAVLERWVGTFQTAYLGPPGALTVTSGKVDPVTLPVPAPSAVDVATKTYTSVDDRVVSSVVMIPDVNERDDPLSEQ